MNSSAYSSKTSSSVPGGPLAGVKVLDMTHALAGPYTTMLLAGLGAEIIKLERPVVGEAARTNSPYYGENGPSLTRDSDDDMSLALLVRNRNKLGITLDLKSPEAPEIFADLVRHVDVIVENWSRGTADRIGVGYEQAARINSRIIYCSISGFGAVGEPGVGRAMDSTIQAMSGLMFTPGNEGDPPVRNGVPLGDLSAPPYAAIGILSALFERQTSGVGQHIDISMLGVLSSIVAAEPFEVLDQLGIPVRSGNLVPRLAPFGVFAAQDGYVAISSNRDGMVRDLFALMGRSDLIGDERFATRDARVRHADELHALVAAWVATQLSADVQSLLEANGIPVAPVRTPSDAARDELSLARGDLARLEHPLYGEAEDIYVPGIPIRFSRSQASLNRPAPQLGEHNREVYVERLGYSEERLVELRASKAI